MGSGCADCAALATAARSAVDRANAYIVNAHDTVPPELRIDLREAMRIAIDQLDDQLNQTGDTTA